MNAVILAGGFGDRLKPFTAALPKPSLNVGNIPMIDYTVSQLGYFGIKDIVFALAYLPEKIIEWTVGYKNLTCHYNIETMPLGTCGAVKDAQNYLDDEFFVLSGDGISDIDLSDMLKMHRKSNAKVTMAVTSVRNPWLYGLLTTDKKGYVTSFIEKPQRHQDSFMEKPQSLQDTFSEKSQSLQDSFVENPQRQHDAKISDNKSLYQGSYINCGAYILDKSVLDLIPAGTSYDFARDLFPHLLSCGQKIATYVHNGYWSDVGSLESYHKTNLDIMRNGSFFPYEYNLLRKHFESRVVDRLGTSLVGKSSKLVGSVSNCVIGNSCNILSSAVLESCIVLDGVTVHGRHKNCIIDSKYAVNVPKSGGNDILYAFDGTTEEYFLQ